MLGALEHLCLSYWTSSVLLIVFVIVIMKRSSTKPSSPPQAYILHTSVTHGRYLPVESKHAFTYPALFLFVPLRALESNLLDTGLVFGYSKPKRRIVAISPRGYLSSGCQGEAKTILQRLEGVLKRKIEDAWMLTMPSFLGWEGINPLTVYFVYDAMEFTHVVLEIHNTFGESHAYVLKVGEGEDADEQLGRSYDHQWTFPREFHVSPFNDRSGFYTVSVKRPTHPPSRAPTSESPPKPAVRVQLYTQSPADSQLRGELKLTAVLRPTASLPLTSGHLLHSLMKMPFDLLLTMVRIHYQAWILHYGKPRLDVYLRPEMRKPGGGIRWLDESLVERYARWRVERFLERRVDEVGVMVTLVPANPAQRTRSFVPATGTGEEDLRIEYLSSKLFTTLLLAPSAEHALLLGVDTEGWFEVSSRDVFVNVFAAGEHAYGRSSLQRLRMRALPGDGTEKAIPIPVPQRHFLDQTGTLGVLDWTVVSIQFTLDRLEKVLFGWAKARVVSGQEPWLLWEKAAKVYRDAGTRTRDGHGLGSVRNGDLTS